MRNDAIGAGPKPGGAYAGRGVRPVVVVGGGVSGCACAATLAAKGVEVTLVSSALDAVGLPTVGPDVVAGGGGRREILAVFGALPEALRDVWVGAMVTPQGASYVCVDRRMVSVETKRALESMPGLELRQGLVSDLKVGRCGPDSVGEQGGSQGIAVGTVFGETLQTRAVVVAVGLSLGGHVAVGEQTLCGGGDGETVAGDLRVALEELGASFREVEVEVGPCFPGAAVWGEGSAGRGKMWGMWSGVGLGGRRLKVVPVVREREGESAGGGWSAEYPPAPHCTESLWGREAVVATDERGSSWPVVSPDGVATGEVRLGAGCDWSELTEVAEGGRGTRFAPAMACRLPRRVRAVAVGNLNQTGRLVVGDEAGADVWVTGRAGGAAGYVESLLAGVRTGIDAAAALGAGV